MGKLLWFIIIVAAIYFIFFRPKQIKENQVNESKNSEDNLVEMVECVQCKSYVSKNDAIIKDNKYYCSVNCFNKAIKA